MMLAGQLHRKYPDITIYRGFIKLIPVDDCSIRALLIILDLQVPSFCLQ